MPRSNPPFELPSIADLHAAAETHSFSLSEDEAAEYRETLRSLRESYEWLAEQTSDPLAVTRDIEWETPTADEDPFNSYVVRCRLAESTDGPLGDLTLGVKDNISVSGLPMRCGGEVFQDYVPEIDATVVQRLLTAGATISGKLAMSDMGYDGTGLLSATGPIRNPRDDTRMAGGSSGGPAAAVVSGDVDVAIGGDQGGSIRIPASWCGCVGLKPTFGLVPYTGIVGMEPSNDHAGPLALTVHDCAQVLEVIAGPDGLDPRQNPSINPESYTEGVGESVDEISIGVIEEGFGQAESDPRVDDAVAEALNSFRPEVSEVQWTSVPIHTRGEAIFNGVEIEGMTALLRDETVGRYLRGYYDTTRAVAFGNASDERADAYPPTLKRVLLLGEYLHSEYHGKFYTIAQNLRRELITAYDDLFTEFDILALPTTPQLPHTYRSDLSTREIISYTLDMTQNTVQFNLTGHPAISVPCGTVEDLPVGLMLVAPMFDDARLLRVASAFERAVSPEIWQQPETS